MGSIPSTCWSWAGSKPCCRQPPTIARPARSSRGLYRRADEGIGPYGNAEGFRSCVVHAPMTARAARSEAERAEREAGQMRSCTPTNHRTRAAGIRHQACTAPRRARRTVPVNPQAPSHADPRRARRATAPERVKAPFSLTPGAARSLFGQDQKENGGRIPRGNGPLAGARFPVQWDAPHPTNDR